MRINNWSIIYAHRYLIQVEVAMKAKELKVGEWVEYKQHPVEVVNIDMMNEQATVWDSESNAYRTINTEQLDDDPQCHCDSHTYY